MVLGNRKMHAGPWMGRDWSANKKNLRPWGEGIRPQKKRLRPRARGFRPKQKGLRPRGRILGQQRKCLRPREGFYANRKSACGHGSETKNRIQMVSGHLGPASQNLVFCNDATATLKLAHLGTPERFLSDAGASHTNEAPTGSLDTLGTS